MSDGEARARYQIANVLGLHARAATKLVQLASKYPCEVNVGREGQTANAKSVMGVLLLLCPKGTRVVVRAEGDDAAETVAAIGELFRSRFGESR